LALDDFFAGRALSRQIFDALSAAITGLGEVQVRVTKSQVAFARRRAFAWAWLPEMYLGRGAPLVLTVALRRRETSPRWKQVVEPVPGRFTHHLELYAPEEVDTQVTTWIREAWNEAA
jgi:hypothetical protein